MTYPQPSGCNLPGHQGQGCTTFECRWAPPLPLVLDVAAAGPWQACACGHLMLLHDVEDMDGSNPTCCVEGCTQQGCGGRKGEQDAG